MSRTRVGQKRVEVWVDEALYDRVTADRPRGWLAEQVRAALTAADGVAADPNQGQLIDLGPVADDLSTMRVTARTDGQGNVVPVHRFRRGQALDTRYMNGQKQTLYACADECGIERWS